jgi:hypothetical protein
MASAVAMANGAAKAAADLKSRSGITPVALSHTEQSSFPLKHGDDV